MAEAKIVVSAQDDGAVDLFARLTNGLNELGSSFVARVAEGVLLRDAIREVINVVKEGIDAFPDLVKHTIETGNSLYEMSLKTGASVENLSALRYVASQTGIDFDSFGNTLYKMEVALGSSGQKADELQKHLDLLGLNMQTLKNEKPDEAFIDIMSALEEIPNRADQAAIGMAVFGKGFKDMAGLTQESITDLIQEANDLGLVMSTETAAAAHAAEIGFKSFQMQLEAVGMEVGATVLPALVALMKLLSGEFHDGVEAAGHPVIDLKANVEAVIMKMLDWSTVAIDTAQFLDNAFQGTKAMLFDIEAKIVGVASAFVGFLQSAVDAANKIPGMRGDFDGLSHSLQDANTWITGFQQGLRAESDGALDAAAKHAQLFDGLRAGVADVKSNFHDGFTKAVDEIADFADKSHNAYGGIGSDVEGGKDKVDKFANAWANLNSIGESVEDTVSQINPTLVDQISYYIEAGAKVSDLAEAYSDVLTPAQVEAIDKLVRGNERYARSWQATEATISRVWDDAFAREQENGLRGLDLELARLSRQEQGEKDAAAKKITDETQLQEMLAAIDAKYDGLRADAKTKNDQQVADKTDALWLQYYDNVGKKTLSTTEYQIAQVQRWYDNEVDKAIKAGIVDQGYYDALSALADVKMHDVYLANDRYAQDTRKLLDDLTNGKGGWSDTFATILSKTGDFHQAAAGIFGLLKTDVEKIFADMLSNVLQGFFAPLESQLGSLLAKLAGIGGGGGFWGFLGSLLPGASGSSGGPGENPNDDAEGGIIQAFGDGGRVYPLSVFAPRGSDTVPAMLTPGERVLTVADTQTFDRAGGVSALRSGTLGGLSTADLHSAMHSAVSAAMKPFIDMMQVQFRSLPGDLRHAMRGAR